MTITIEKPELEALIKQQLESGLFQGIDELLTKALHAFKEHSVSTLAQPRTGRLIDVLSSTPFAGSELDIERQREY